MAESAATMPAMSLRAALAALQTVRSDEVVLTTMGAGREWDAISRHALDFCHVPACMGHTSAIGLGLALAKPSRHVIVLNGDGSMLMSLGNLVTIASVARAGQALKNFTLVVCDNGVYEVTGRQLTPGGSVDYPGLARAAGLRHVWSFDDLPAWRSSVSSILASPGPRFIHLRVEPTWNQDNLAVPMRETVTAQVARLREMLTNAEGGMRNAE
jgi:thiamine pyrophosphate-dependent acetolactate synthase large subunit-like protein